jgi:hypothetical protein
MAVNLSMLAGVGAQFFDNNGIPLAGGLIYTYAAGTNTPQATYTTSAGSIAHANPIVLDSAGRTPSGGEIWLTDAVAYKFVLKTATSTTIGTYDNVTGNSSGIYAAFAASSGSSLVGFIQTGTGATATTVQARLRQTVSVKDFGAVGDGTTDDTTAITNAIAATPVGGQLYFPTGTYKLTSEIVIQKSITLNGDIGRYGDLFDADWTATGGGTVIYQTSLTANAIRVENASSSQNIIFQATNLVIRGAYVSPGGSSSGSGLVLKNTYASALHFILRNVQVGETHDYGIRVTGQVYGCRADNVGTYWTGKNGILIDAAPTGTAASEMLWSNTRVFNAGKNGTTVSEQIGLLVNKPIGSGIRFEQLICSVNNGPAARFIGEVQVDGMLCESNDRVTGNNYYIGIGDNAASSTSIIIRDLTILLTANSPSALGYEGNVLYCEAAVGNQTRQVLIDGVRFNGEIRNNVGYHVKNTSNQILSYTLTNVSLETESALLVDDSSAYSIINQWNATSAFSAYLSAGGTDVTGDGTVYTPVWDAESYDSEGVFSTSTGKFTCRSAGNYQFNVAFQLTGIDTGQDRGFIYLRKNASTLIAQVLLPSIVAIKSGTSRANILSTFNVALARGDTVYVELEVGGGSKTLDIAGTATNATYFAGSRIY